uniref:LRRCT domain-containing protein n=1 Tax=Anopheles coluzzii TaxID=1518534 RepID=A0A8W7P525_ANOCL
MQNVHKVLLVVVVVILGASHRNGALCNRTQQRVAVLVSVEEEMDHAFFAHMPPTSLDVHVWHTESERLEVTADNPLQALSLMEAPKLQDLILYPNAHLRQLIVRHCPLDGVTEQFRNLRELRILKIEQCRLTGAFDLGVLLAFHNLTSVSLEANHITEASLLVDETAAEPEQPSKLARLDLSSNQIEYFHLDAVRLFPALKELLLGRNKLVTFAGGNRTFLPALVMLDVRQNLLTELDLSGCDCSSLLYLYATSNRLTSFPVFGDSTVNIKALDLCKNQLTVPDAQQLQKQQRLTSLLLSQNAFRSFTTETETELPSLVRLELYDNQLESLDLRGWKLPALAHLRVSQNPLKSIPDDLLARYPNLTKLTCFCPDVDCTWIQRNVANVRNGQFEMSVAWKGPKSVGKGYRCVTVPYVGCVRCPFKRTAESDLE